MKKILLAIIIPVFLLTGCEWLEQNAPSGLTDGEIIEGLKTALNVGSDSASGSLSLDNGYYGNILVKIPLPEEAELVRTKINANTTLASISELIGLEAKFEDVIKAVNHAAEDAAKEAAPIFKGVISELSISQGWDILHGVVPGSTKSTGFDSTAATKYLSLKTYAPLTEEYAPKINTSLGKVQVAGYSATQAWEGLTSTYNTFIARSDVKTAISFAKLIGNDPNLPSSINSNLGEFSTQKALDGLFLMVGKEEKKIRQNPWAWAKTVVGSILEKVFGNVE